jgi:hypothetical protein
VGVEPPFLAVSVFKLAVMNFCTFTVYEVIFAVFFCYQCFGRMRDHEGGVELGPRLDAAPLAIGFILSTLTWRLPDPWDWISVASFVFTLPVQHHVNRLNAQVSPAHDRNGRFTAWNWVAVVVGGPLMLVMIADSLSLLGP